MGPSISASEPTNRMRLCVERPVMVNGVLALLNPTLPPCVMPSHTPCAADSRLRVGVGTSGVALFFEYVIAFLIQVLTGISVPSSFPNRCLTGASQTAKRIQRCSKDWLRAGRWEGHIKQGPPVGLEDAKQAKNSQLPGGRLAT